MLEAGFGAATALPAAAAATVALPGAGGGGYLDSSCLTPYLWVSSSQEEDTINTLPQFAAWLQSTKRIKLQIFVIGLKKETPSYHGFNMGYTHAFMTSHMYLAPEALLAIR